MLIALGGIGWLLFWFALQRDLWRVGSETRRQFVRSQQFLRKVRVFSLDGVTDQDLATQYQRVVLPIWLLVGTGWVGLGLLVLLAGPKT
jgi:hypothetical protein